MSTASQRTALVTGGGSGIGAAAALRLGRDGFTVVVADIDRTAAARTAGALEAEGRPAFALRVDVRYMVSRIPMGRIGQPPEVAALISWLCSEECSFSTGAVFDISGGRATY